MSSEPADTGAHRTRWSAPGCEVAWLREQLAAASALDGREGAAAALNAVHAALLDLGFNLTELRPLFGLMGALQDHARGKRNPLLAFGRPPGNRAHIADDMCKCCAAATATILIGFGNKPDEAFQRVAEALSHSERKISKIKIRTWHHEMVNERHPAVGEYKAILAKLRSKVEPDPSSAGRALLETLPTLFRQNM